MSRPHYVKQPVPSSQNKQFGLYFLYYWTNTQSWTGFKGPGNQPRGTACCRTADGIHSKGIPCWCMISEPTNQRSMNVGRIWSGSGEQPWDEGMKERAMFPRCVGNSWLCLVMPYPGTESRGQKHCTVGCGRARGNAALARRTRFRQWREAPAQPVGNTLSPPLCSRVPS